MKSYILISLILFVMYVFFSDRLFEGFASEVGPSETGAISSETGAIEVISSQKDDLTTNLGDITGESLCSIYASKPEELNSKCGELTEKNCNSTSCCLWLNGQSCVAGNANGPTFRTTGGKNIDIKYYSYKNNLVGSKN